MNAYAWALLTAAIWGVVPLMEKSGLGQASAVAGVWLRSVGVMLGMLVLTLLAPWNELRAMPPRSILLLVAGGCLASVGGQMVFYQALRSGEVSQVTPVAGAYPMITVLLGWLLFHEPISAQRSLGALCVVAGIILLRR